MKVTELPVSVTSPTLPINHYHQHLSHGPKTKAHTFPGSVVLFQIRVLPRRASEGKMAT
jgi:hypothetical protein